MSLKSILLRDKSKSNNAKQSKKASALIDFPDELYWWQDDKTPMNSKGKPMTFICQVDIYKVF